MKGEREVAGQVEDLTWDLLGEDQAQAEQGEVAAEQGLLQAACRVQRVQVIARGGRVQQVILDGVEDRKQVVVQRSEAASR